jgi:gamma-glutamyltranspeptidase/glutathione hydrolase
LERFGTRSWTEVAEYPTLLARDGYPVHDFQSYYIADRIDKYRRFRENARIYLRDGSGPRTGEVLVQSDLGNLFTRLAQAEASVDEGPARRERALDAYRSLFYRGRSRQRWSNTIGLTMLT